MSRLRRLDRGVDLTFGIGGQGEQGTGTDGLRERDRGNRNSPLMPDGCVTSLGGGFDQATGVAVDSSGNNLLLPPSKGPLSAGQT